MDGRHSGSGLLSRPPCRRWSSTLRAEPSRLPLSPDRRRTALLIVAGGAVAGPGFRRRGGRSERRGSLDVYLARRGSEPGRNQRAGARSSHRFTAPPGVTSTSATSDAELAAQARRVPLAVYAPPWHAHWCRARSMTGDPTWAPSCFVSLSRSAPGLRAQGETDVQPVSDRHRWSSP